MRVVHLVCLSAFMSSCSVINHYNVTAENAQQNKPVQKTNICILSLPSIESIPDINIAEMQDINPSDHKRRMDLLIKYTALLKRIAVNNQQNYNASIDNYNKCIVKANAPAP